MPELYKVRLYANHRALAPFATTLIAARTMGEAKRIAQQTARTRGAGFWTVEG